jgi:hypothetical protein
MLDLFLPTRGYLFKIELLMQDEEIDTSDGHMWQCAEGDGSVISYLLHTISKHYILFRSACPYSEFTFNRHIVSVNTLKSFLIFIFELCFGTPLREVHKFRCRSKVETETYPYNKKGRIVFCTQINPFDLFESAGWCGNSHGYLRRGRMYCRPAASYSAQRFRVNPPAVRDLTLSECPDLWSLVTSTNGAV